MAFVNSKLIFQQRHENVSLMIITADDRFSEKWVVIYDHESGAWTAWGVGGQETKQGRATNFADALKQARVSRQMI